MCRSLAATPHRIALTVFGVVLCAYITTTGGSFATDLASFEVTRSLVEHGSVAMGYDVLGTEAERGVDGRYYAPVGIGHSLFGVPFYLAARLAQSAFGLRIGKPDALEKAAVVTGSAVAAAACAPVAFLFAWRLTGSLAGALWAALGLAFGTTLWPYAKFGYNAPLAAAALLSANYWTWQGIRDGNLGKLALGGGLLGCALLTRHEMYLAAVPLGLWVLVESRQSRNLLVRRAVAFGAPVMVAAVLWCWYNYTRFGNPFDTGLLRDPNVRFDTPLIVGLYGLLASPGRSLVLYSPLAAAGIVSLFALARTNRSTAVLVAGEALLLLLLFGSMHQWDGGESYGPRYLVPLLPLLIVPLAAWFPLKAGGSGRYLLPIVFSLSVCVQLPGVLVDYSKTQNAYARRTPGYSIHMSRYAWEATPLVLNTKAAMRAVPQNVRYLLGRQPAVTRTAGQNRRDFSQQFAFSLDFWWLYLFYLGAVPAGVALLLGVTPLALAVWLGNRLCVSHRGSKVKV